MTHEKFDKFLEEEIIKKIRSVLSSKSADYSKGDDKLYNFKLAGRIDGISSIESLRGMQLKHLASAIQGLDEIKNGGSPRTRDWFHEKCIDLINYYILLLALLEEEYYEKV